MRVLVPLKREGETTDEDNDDDSSRSSTSSYTSSDNDQEISARQRKRQRAVVETGVPSEVPRTVALAVAASSLETDSVSSARSTQRGDNVEESESSRNNARQTTETSSALSTVSLTANGVRTGATAPVDTDKEHRIKKPANYVLDLSHVPSSRCLSFEQTSNETVPSDRQNSRRQQLGPDPSTSVSLHVGRNQNFEQSCRVTSVATRHGSKATVIVAAAGTSTDPTATTPSEDSRSHPTPPSSSSTRRKPSPSAASASSSLPASRPSPLSSAKHKRRRKNPSLRNTVGDRKQPAFPVPHPTSLSTPQQKRTVTSLAPVPQLQPENRTHTVASGTASPTVPRSAPSLKRNHCRATAKTKPTPEPVKTSPLDSATVKTGPVTRQTSTRTGKGIERRQQQKQQLPVNVGDLKPPARTSQSTTSKMGLYVRRLNDHEDDYREMPEDDPSATSIARDGSANPNRIRGVVRTHGRQQQHAGHATTSKQRTSERNATDLNSHREVAAAEHDDATTGKDDFMLGLKKRGLEIQEQEGDGNCLFRAVSLQVYGDPSMHGDVRRQCMDFMERDREHFSSFVTGEPFDQYVERKRRDGVHGNNPEIQAISELFNRPVEVYCPENGSVPINIFHADYKTGDVPIRLSYHDGNHYNAVIDPLVPTAGLGLGLPGLQPGLADKMQVARAVAASDEAADQEELQRVLKKSEDDELQRAIKESSLSVETMYNNRALNLSDADATYFEMEQAVLEQSLREQAECSDGMHLDRKKQEARVSSSDSSKREVQKVGPCSGTASATIPAAASSKQALGSIERNGAVNDDTCIPPAAASVASAPSAASAAASSDDASTGTGMLSAAEEYPPTVQELAMNGFPLQKVVKAYELLGDNFDELLMFLMGTSSV